MLVPLEFVRLVSFLSSTTGKPRELTKQVMRRELIDKLVKNRDEDIQNFVDCITHETVQQAIGEQIQRMSKAKK